jgi:hypothetical protein
VCILDLRIPWFFLSTLCLVFFLAQHKYGEQECEEMKKNMQSGVIRVDPMVFFDMMYERGPGRMKELFILCHVPFYYILNRAEKKVIFHAYFGKTLQSLGHLENWEFSVPMDFSSMQEGEEKEKYKRLILNMFDDILKARREAMGGHGRFKKHRWRDQFMSIELHKRRHTGIFVSDDRTGVCDSDTDYDIETDDDVCYTESSSAADDDVTIYDSKEEDEHFVPLVQSKRKRATPQEQEDDAEEEERKKTRVEEEEQSSSSSDTAERDDGNSEMEGLKTKLKRCQAIISMFQRERMQMLSDFSELKDETLKQEFDELKGVNHDMKEREEVAKKEEERLRGLVSSMKEFQTKLQLKVEDLKKLLKCKQQDMNKIVKETNMDKQNYKEMALLLGSSREEEKKAREATRGFVKKWEIMKRGFTDELSELRATVRKMKEETSRTTAAHYGVTSQLCAMKRRAQYAEQNLQQLIKKDQLNRQQMAKDLESMQVDTAQIKERYDAMLEEEKRINNLLSSELTEFKARALHAEQQLFEYQKNNKDESESKKNIQEAFSEFATKFQLYF